MADRGMQRLMSIFEAMDDGIYLINRDFVIEFMNRKMIQDFGEGSGMECFRVIHNLDSVCPWCRAKEVFEGKTVQWEHRFSKLNRTYTLTELSLKNPDGTLSKLSICRDITQRKKREEELRATEEDYRGLFEHVGVGVYISSKEGKFLDANKALLDMLGYENKEEFLKIDIASELYVRPEDRKRFQEMIEKQGRVINYEVDFKRKDGTTVPVLHTGHARYGPGGEVLGYEGINVDQTRRKAMERQLTEANDFLNKIIQSSPNAIMASDMKGNMLIWNPAAEEILGYKIENVIGKMNIVDIYPEGVAKEVMAMLRSREYGGVGRLNSHPMVYVRRDQQIVEGNLSAAIIYDSYGKETATVGIFVDLKERLEMESRLREIQGQLLQSEKLAAMGRLISQLAHELNNPLYGIMNTLELLKTEISPENKRRKILDMALSETARLAEMLRKMLSFSKPDQEEKQRVDINTVIDEILLLHEKQLREMSIKLLCSFGPEIPGVWASKSQLRQVFLNMISNARDAMPEGGTLSITTSFEDGDVNIVISDTGTGIKEEHLGKIFDAFFTTKDSIKDVGLGLSVCYGFIKEHGGDIKVNSEKGSGATFTITLPAGKTISQVD